MIPYRVRAATARDAPGIRALFARAYGAEWPEAEWEWKFLRNPDGWYGVVAEAEDGEIVGNFSGWPMRFRIDGESRLVYSAGDVATAPAARGLAKARNVYGDMATLFYDTAREQGAAFTFGFPHPRAHEISRRLGKTIDYFPIREIRVDCAALPPAPRDFAADDHVGPAFDALWNAAASRLAAAPVRDRERVNWRFHARPTRYYRLVRTVDRGGDAGFAALSVVGDEALVADYLGREGDAADLLPLFAACGEEARRLGAKRLRFWRTPGGAGRRALERLAGDERDAGYWIVGRMFDENGTRAFLERGHFVPALHDVV